MFQSFIAMFRNAIVRLPAPSLINGLTSANLGKPDFVKAAEQHLHYRDMLGRLGLTVEVLPANDLYPDSTFIEDVALCTKSCAIITSPGAVSRRGETEGIKPVLEKYYENVEKITLPGTVEAGDIMKVGDHFYIGISERTNNNGADQMIKILEKFGMTGSKVILRKMLHLKSGLSYLENNTMLVCGEFADTETFKKYNRIVVDRDESYAANSLWINGKVIVPQGYSKTREKIEMAGYETITLDVSEFCKVDGGLSCLSLRF
jgi:dimethylargininase